ncbi:hypothetical protein E1301_Tti014854 [Triplophysa tibetana]|uniref:Retrotransposon gag domain-containing protein n=1 Tax=Triplophysa tibetana TaxID=1572043 RepID=A0A5A9NES0_9TELE|nr:hypothetical protein E1301_Tti014854 [Triplophysa tibetana]
MSRSPSPATHWDQLETWLSAMTEGLPLDTKDVQGWDRKQLDDNLNQLMAQDPTQSYTHKELAKTVGTLAHNLIAQLKLSDGNVSLLEQETTALKLQAEEARRNQAEAQENLDQLTLETQGRTKEECDSELKEKVERLEDTVTDLRADTEARERLEKKAREDLESRLRKAETLLRRAEIELKEREAKLKASERHCQSAQAEAQDLAQQHDQLRSEFDTVQRELKYAYILQAERKGEGYTPDLPPASKIRLPSQAPSEQGEAASLQFKTSPVSLQEPLTATEGWKRLQRTPTNHSMAPKDLDKLARNIPTFTPNPAGGHDIHAYLQDINFHLKTMPNVPTGDRLYLLRITSSREVRSFLDRQSDSVKGDYEQLQQALIREFADPESEQGLVAAMDLKQSRLETPQAYYNRLRRTYFGARNEPEMEEDFNFRTLFLRNLHPSVSHHLGVTACPRTMTTQQLRDLAHKAYVKHKTASEKTVKNPVILPVSEQYPDLTLEGSQPRYNARPVHREARDFPVSQERRDRTGARPKRQAGYPERPWNRPRSWDDPRGGAAWEGSRRPRNHRPTVARETSPNRHQRNAPQHPGDLSKPHCSAEQNRTETSESAEILKILRELMQKGPNKQNKKDKPDSL